jgi:hypothetical protein
LQNKLFFYFKKVILQKKGKDDAVPETIISFRDTKKSDVDA